MFGKLFRVSNQNELTVYNLMIDYINSLKDLMDSWIANNKYKNIKEFTELFNLLLEIEMNIRFLESKQDKRYTKDLAKEYQNLEICLNKIKNKILSVCENSYDDTLLLQISASLIQLRGIIERNINLNAVKATAFRFGGNYDLLNPGQAKSYNNIIGLEEEIYIRKNEIAISDMKYNKR